MNMDAQSESCEPPPCDPQPQGKIRKALKLFSKRKPGNGVASIFSMRGKGEGGLKSPPSRSKTVDGLTETVAQEAEAESLDLDPEDSHKEDVALDEPMSRENSLESTSTRQSISSLTSAKSLSFLNMLRRSRKGGGGERQAQTESYRPGQQRKGLKSLFGSVRWNRKDKEEEEDEVAPGPPLLASRSNSVEIMKENLTLTPRPARHSTDESEFEQQPPPSQDDPAPSEDTKKVSEFAKPSTNDRLSTLLGDISSILSFDSLAGGGDIVADVEAEWVKVSSRVEGGAGAGETAKKDKALSAPKPTLSPAFTLCSTSSTKPSPTSTTKLISSSTASPKPMPSLTTKQTLSTPSTRSPTTSTKPTPSPISLPTICPTAKPAPSSVPSSVSSPIPSPKPMPVTTTIPKSPPTTPTSIIPTKPTLTPTSPPIPGPSPTPSSTPSPASTPAAISETLISLTEKSSPEPADAQTAAITKPTLTPAPTPIMRPTPFAVQETKHITAPATKYPPFITSIKPVPTAPATRPKIVTTFGLSTSRNTAPIIKSEPKQSQIKPSPSQSLTDRNGSGPIIPKAPAAEPGPPHVAKHLSVASPPPAQPNPVISSVTSAKPTHKPEPVYTSLPSGFSLLPTLSPRPPPTIVPSSVPREEKEQEDVANQRVAEEPQLPPSYKPEKKTLVMKPTTLSKIPVSGGGKPKQHHRDTQSNGDEGHWNLPTPVHEDESPISSFSQESSSKDALSDLSTESGAITPVLSHSNEDMLDSAARPIIGTVSLPRESKIPIKPGSTATYHSLQGKTEVARSKIPVSKVPVRRTSNKPAPTSTAAVTRK